MSEIYALLEEKMITASDLLSIPVVDSPEPLVPIVPTARLSVRVIDEESKQITGDNIYVRESVAVKVFLVSQKIGKMIPGATIEVVYGYRSLKRQRELYAQISNTLVGMYEPGSVEEIEAIHKMIALPEVSGHPTGGAVDLRPLVDGEPVDMGTTIWDFTPDSYVFSPYITKEAWKNRQSLRWVMMQEGFAPFDGEWWHFSYGDREWASFYGKPNAIYDQLEFAKNQNSGRMEPK